MARGASTRTWRSGIAVDAAPEHVLDLLTDVDACDAWSPVHFEVDGVGPTRLRTGSTTTVSGRLAGRRVEFRVKILQADSERLVLRAIGPVEMEACYVVGPSSEGSHVDAEITVRRGGGCTGGLAARATSVLLCAGALDHTLARIAREAERRHRRTARAPQRRRR
jgi:hypothetical protein